MDLLILGTLVIGHKLIFTDSEK